MPCSPCLAPKYCRSQDAGRTAAAAAHGSLAKDTWFKTYDAEYRVGPTRVFAYLDTAEGPYELVADTRSGWLLPSSSMLAGFDYSKPDYIIRERPDEAQRGRLLPRGLQRVQSISIK